MDFDEIIKSSTPIVIGIRDKKYVPKLTRPDSPSIPGSFTANKKKKNIIPRRINNEPAIPLDIFRNFMIYFGKII